MNALQIILLVIVVLSGYPIGRFIASNTKEELKAGKIYFKIIMLISVVGAIFSSIFYKGDILLRSLVCLLFIFLIAFSALKYKNKK